MAHHLYGKIANAVLWFQSPLDSRLAKTASLCTCVSALCIGFIIYTNHVYFIRPPPFLGLFLTITIILDSVVTRAYYRRTGLGTIAQLHISVPVLKGTMLVLEEISKRSLVIAPRLRENLGSESFAGFWSTSPYLWLNRIMFIGMRGRLTTGLLPGISQEIDPVVLYKDFSAIWGTADERSKYALARACFLSAPWPFVYVILPRLFSTGFHFAQPFLLQDIVNAVAAKTQDMNIVKGLISATAFIFIGKAVSQAWYLYIKNRMATTTRAILVTAIYQKSLRLSKDELAKEAAVTLINTDVANVMLIIALSYECWVTLVEIILGLTILTRFVGSASIFALIPTGLSSVFTYFISKKLAFSRREWNGHIQTRVADTSNMLAQMKDIKMTGLAPTLAKRLQRQQVAETKIAMENRRAVAGTFSFSAIGETITPVLVVAGTMFWTRASEPITSARFFTTLAVVTLISRPLADFLTGLPAWTSAFGAVDRIQAYLKQEEDADERKILVSQIATDSGSSSGAQPRNSIALRNRQPSQRPRVAVKLQSVAVSVGPSASVLKDVTISIPFGQTTVLTGPVGCGKSALLSAITGQAKLSAGSVAVCTKKIAYCAQRPWLRNTTIQRNILGFSSYNAALYQRVIFTSRAFYSGAELVVLDDPLSALDKETSSAIRARLFGKNGFLEENSTTIIMATSVQQDLADADAVLKVLEDGRVVPSTDTKSAVTTSSDDTSGDTNPAPDETQTTPASQRSDETAENGYKPPSVEPTPDDDKSSPWQEAKFGDFSLYSYFTRPAGLLNLLQWTFLVVVAAVVERMYLIWGRICGFFYLINASAMEALHWQLADTTTRATFEFLAAEDAGSVLNRFSTDTSIISQRLPIAILPSAWGFLSVLIDIGIIASGASYAAPIMPVLLLGLFVVQYFYLRTSRQLRSLELDTSKLMVRQLSETSGGIAHVRSFKWEDFFVSEFYEILEKTQKPFYFMNIAQQWLLMVLDMFSAGAGIVMITLAFNYPSSASANSMGLAFVSLISFSQIVSLFIRYFTNMEIAFGAVARIRAFATGTPLELDDCDASDLPPEWPQNGKVEFSGVTVVYKSKAENGEEAEHKGLDNLAITVKPGSTLGIMGRTGSGKTSLLLALLRLVKYSGKITIDGRDIESVPLNILRTRITTITQSGLELIGSVRFNLNPFDRDCFPPDYTLTEDMQIDVLEQVGLMERIDARGGLEADFAAMRFSQGQKQLFQLARAMLHQEIMKSPLLVIDEGTSSVDEETEERMRILVHEAFASCTKFIITHRGSILNRSDTVLRLSRGKMVAMTSNWEAQNGERSS
ncbi:ABC transporter, transmembrane domain, type 1 [Akanthomyces lecanii RCEF 1005]|uniref:ABC transporter, transmembrane domain, type 1 n=1 Tax=Akanthomyces lecanii RCEF 1005 TaxID=1081108 RepID=A0A168GRZ0_CORDF|nr:ABC transporter, transmembrane domain, type 1 [Akanthomyces lecanii RCEF 1005]